MVDVCESTRGFQTELMIDGFGFGNLVIAFTSRVDFDVMCVIMHAPIKV